MKKLTKYITFTSLVLLLFSGCEDFKLGNDFLEKRTSTDVSIDEVYSKKVYAEQALAEVYRSLPEGLPVLGRLKYCMLESITDLADSPKSGGLIDYFGLINSATAGSVLAYRLDDDDSRRGPCSGIRRAYLFIENVDRVPDMTADEKEIRKAEAKLIIAYHNSNMLRYYGGMPWISHSYQPQDNFTTERLTVEEYVNKIVDLIDEVAAVLPWSVPAADDGRMTKAAAMALKVRVLLFAASPLFNDNQPYAPGEAADKKYVWYGNKDQARWQRALDAGLAFMAEKGKSGQYNLVKTGNPRADFQAGHFKRNNGEILISSRWHVTINANMIEYKQIQMGVAVSTLNLVDMFPMADGTDFDWNNPVHAANPFFKAGKTVRDPRLYETCIVNEDSYAGRKAECYIGGREYNIGLWINVTGFGIRKFIQDRSANIGKFYEWPILRLPEVYLSIAEALNEMDRTAEAYPYINMIRQRAGMPDLTPGLDKDHFREALLRERVLELAYEEVRFFDLTRWKRSDIWKTTYNLRGLKITKTGTTFTYNQVNVLNKRASSLNWDDHYFLQPIPLAEVNKKYGLIQNPGW